MGPAFIVMGGLKEDTVEPPSQGRPTLSVSEKTKVTVTIPTELRVRMSTLGVHPQSVAIAAWRKTVKAKEMD